MGDVYDVQGRLILLPGETEVAAFNNWDIDVISPWRRIMPKTIFPGYHGKASSTLCVTSQRIVLIRRIDDWRELAERLTPLGLPDAAAREAELEALKREGVRQFCEILTGMLRIVSAKRHRNRSMLDIRLVDPSGRRYGILLWKTDGEDEKAADVIQSRFLP